MGGAWRGRASALAADKPLAVVRNGLAVHRLPKTKAVAAARKLGFQQTAAGRGVTLTRTSRLMHNELITTIQKNTGNSNYVHFVLQRPGNKMVWQAMTSDQGLSLSRQVPPQIRTLLARA
jgi:hypothetical protein